MTRVALVGCGKSKRPGSHPARDLYTGPLFRAALAHAERTAERVFIVSAKYGLLPLDRVVESYDERLPRDREKRLTWARGVLVGLLHHVPGEMALTIYAGRDYADLLFDQTDPTKPNRERFVRRELPLDRLTQGARLAWFKQRRSVS